MLLFIFYKISYYEKVTRNMFDMATDLMRDACQ